MRRTRWIATAWPLALLAGCVASHPQPVSTNVPALPAPALHSSGATATYHDHGIAFSYPAAWKPAKGDTAVFRVVAPGATAADLDLDVPAVPGFAAVFVNPNLVASRYGEDEKKAEIPDAVVTFSDVSAGGGTARRVKLVGHDAHGRAAINEAVALVHGGRVYILSTNTDGAGYPAAKTALDAAVASVQWDS